MELVGVGPENVIGQKYGHMMQRRLPLYGPLNIEDPEEYLENAKETFMQGYKSIFPYVIKLHNFENLHLLGEGSFGKVVLVKFKLFESSYYAMKAISKKHLVEKHFIGHALNEKRILQSLNWPFCLRLEYFYHDNSYIYFILPFMCGGELFTHLRMNKRFSENVAQFYSAQVVLGLGYLHNLDLAYRDLKPENILLDHHGYLKIGDFGFAKIVTSRTYTFCGTPDYLAPEIIMGHGYGKAVDWWALGVLIYELVSGHPPFMAGENIKLFKRIVKKQFKIPKSFSQPLRDLIGKLLQDDLSKRLGNLRRGVDDIKNHAFFKEINWDQILNRRTQPPYTPDASLLASLKYFPSLKRCSTFKISEENQFEELFEDF